MTPFPGGIDSLANGTLVFSAAFALLYLPMHMRPPSWRRTAARSGAVALLAVLVLIEAGPLPLAAALLLAAAGDASLAQEDERSFRAGLGLFLAARIVYAVLFVTSGSGVEILAAQPWRMALPVIVTLAALPLAMRTAPAATYAAITIVVMWSAATVPVPLVMVGAALLVVADAFLIAPPASRRGQAGAASWVLCWIAQVAIALSFLL